MVVEVISASVIRTTWHVTAVCCLLSVEGVCEVTLQWTIRPKAVVGLRREAPRTKSIQLFSETTTTTTNNNNKVEQKSKSVQGLKKKIKSIFGLKGTLYVLRLVGVT